MVKTMKLLATVVDCKYLKNLEVPHNNILYNQFFPKKNLIEMHYWMRMKVGMQCLQMIT